MRFINRQQIQEILDEMAENEYKNYLREVIREIDGEKPAGNWQ
jgi:hypothetical protein